MASPPSLRLLSVLSAQALPPQCLSCTCILFLTVNRCPCFSHRVPPSSVLLLTLPLPSFASHVWKKSLCILSTLQLPHQWTETLSSGASIQVHPHRCAPGPAIGVLSLWLCFPCLPLPPFNWGCSLGSALCPLSPSAPSLPLPVLLPAPQPVLRGSLWLCSLLLEQSWPHSLGSPALTPSFPCSQQNQNHFWGHSSPAACSLCLFFH